MSSRLFVVSGSPRSLLERTARVLTALGAPCGHEEVFSPASFRAGRTLYWPPSLSGDASWFAAPVLGKLPDGAIVLHQVRDPLEVVAELWTSRFFEIESEERSFAEDFIPELARGGPLVRAMRHWLEWNQMIEAAGELEDLVYRRITVESLSPTTIVETAALLGIARDRSTAETALAEVIDDAEAPAPVKRLGWSDLPPCSLTDEVRGLAERYGYAA